MHDTERVETHGTDYHWKKENLTSWQLHSGWGPNPDSEAATKNRTAIPFEDLVNPLSPKRAYNANWSKDIVDETKSF